MNGSRRSGVIPEYWPSLVPFRKNEGIADVPQPP